MFVDDQHSTVTLYCDKVTWWTLPLRSPTPINSYASDSKLVPVIYIYSDNIMALSSTCSTSTNCLFQIGFFVFSPILAVGSVWVSHVYTTFQS